MKTKERKRCYYCRKAIKNCICEFPEEEEE